MQLEEKSATIMLVVGIIYYCRIILICWKSACIQMIKKSESHRNYSKVETKPNLITVQKQVLFSLVFDIISTNTLYPNSNFQMVKSPIIVIGLDIQMTTGV